MIGKNGAILNLFSSQSFDACEATNLQPWCIVEGFSHQGHPILRHTATGDLAYDGLADPYPIALPREVEASIRAQIGGAA